VTSPDLKKLIQTFTGFSVVGIISTVFSIVLLYLFLKVFKTPLIATFILIYLATILLSYYLNASLVFKNKQGKSQVYAYMSIYVSSMLLGVFLLWFFKKVTAFDNWILGYMVLPFTMIWNFIFSSLLFSGKLKIK
jgi:putative flippase GtrA